MKTKFKAVIFDIDGTLTTKVSWYYLTENLGADVSKHLEIYHMRLAGQVTRIEARKKILALWKKTGRANRNFMQKAFNQIPIRNDAQGTIDYLKSKGYLLCLITGSMNLYAKAIAKRLSIKNYFANSQLKFNGTGELIWYSFNLKQAELKLKQLKEFCLKNKLKLKDCAVVGDSLNDLTMFKATGNGIIIKTEFEDKELEKVAKIKIANLQNLREIL